MSVHQKLSFLTLFLTCSAAAFCAKLVSFPRNGSEPHSESFFLFFVARKGILSCVLSRGMVRNRIPRVCFYFGSTKWNSKLCSLPQKGSEQNYGSLFLFLFHGTEFRVVLSSAEGFGTEFQEFSVPRNNRNSVGNNHLSRLFRLPRN